MHTDLGEMTSILSFDESQSSRTDSLNYSDDELILKELYSRCWTLKIEQLKTCKLRESLLVINEKNESISKSLLKIKNDYESYKSHLYKTFYDLKVSTDKQKILFKKKSDEYFEKRKAFEAYFTVSPIKYELEELIIKNRSLEEEWKGKSCLLELTKKQYYELLSLVIKTFKKKVCEFCDGVLKLKADPKLE